MRKIFTLAIVGLLLATAVSASAFTTGYVDRTATIDVASDSNGLIQLSSGPNEDLVHASNDELTIDFSNGGADGANSNASFTLGDPANANETYAFDISHTDDQNKDLSLNYTIDSDPVSGTENVMFTVYDSSGTEMLSTSEEESVSGSQMITPSDTVYVVIEVDTTDMSTSDALDGTLRITLS